MPDIYITLAVMAVLGGVLAWLAERAFRGLLGKESPWQWGWLSKPRPMATNNQKFGKLIAVLDVVGLAVAAGILGWHFGVFALPESLLWYVAVPLAMVCAVGRAKAVLRHFRRDASELK